MLTPLRFLRAVLPIFAPFPKILASLQLALDTTFPTRETIKFY
jgi:hypothetical protein